MYSRDLYSNAKNYTWWKYFRCNSFQEAHNSRRKREIAERQTDDGRKFSLFSERKYQTLVSIFQALWVFQGVVGRPSPDHCAVTPVLFHPRTAAWMWTVWTSSARCEGWTARPPWFCARGCGTARFWRCDSTAGCVPSRLPPPRTFLFSLTLSLTLSPNRNTPRWTTWTFSCGLPLMSLPPPRISSCPTQALRLGFHGLHLVDVSPPPHACGLRTCCSGLMSLKALKLPLKRKQIMS